MFSLKKRIVVIGGAGESLVNFRLSLMKSFLRSGYEVYAVATNDPGVKEKLMKNGIFFYSLSLDRHSLSISKGFKYCFSLYKILKKINPEICLCYTLKPVIFGIIAATFSGVKYRYSLITGLGYAFIAKTLKAKVTFFIVFVLYKVAFHLSDKVIFQNKDDKLYCCNLGLLSSKKARVVGGSGVDLSYFTPARFPKKTTFLMIARFLPEKGIFEYVEACRRIKIQYPEIRCCLVGYLDSHLANINEKTVHLWESYGIENFGKQADVRFALEVSSVYVLPSYREGAPRSVLEAMAMSRPIITTDAPGCRETVVEGKNGFLVPIKNSEALYKAMLRFVNDPSLSPAMGEESLRIAKEKFDVNKINQAMFEIMRL